MTTRRFALSLALALVLGGCGGAADEAAPFLGTWQVVAGTLTLNCSNGGGGSSPITSPLTIAAGVASDLVVTDDACIKRFDVNGHVATAQAGQRCADAASGPGVFIVIDSETLTTADGLNATHDGAGRVDGLVDAASGAPISCTWSGVASYRRASK